jgi:hypothetical protein
MRRLLALSAVPGLGLILLGPATPAWAQGNGPCIHQGQQVQCPPGLPPGSQSVSFVPGGTNWRNSVTGAIVFVPSTTFPPFMAGPSPTAPPGPTTQPGPGQPPGGTPGVFPFTTDGFLVLTLPLDLPAAKAMEEVTALQRTLPQDVVRNAQQRLRDAQAEYSARAEEAGEAMRDLHNFDAKPEAEKQAIRDRVNETAKRSLAALDAMGEAEKEYSRALREFERAEGRPYGLGGIAIAALLLGGMLGDPAAGPGADATQKFLEQSDAEKAPTFEPPGGDGKVDDVM